MAKRIRVEISNSGSDITAMVAVREGRHHVEEVTFKAKPGRELASSDFRFRFNDILVESHRLAVRLPSRQRQLEIITAGLIAAQQLPDGVRGRRKQDDANAYSRLIALERLRLETEGQGGRGALERLSARLTELTGRPYKSEAVRDMVHAARERGFLADGIQGRSTAEPGPNFA